MSKRGDTYEKQSRRRDEDLKPHTYGQAAATKGQQAEGRPSRHGHFGNIWTGNTYMGILFRTSQHFVVSVRRVTG
jgi:hypothetical protein